MNAWDRFWYTPLAAARPYLLAKSVLAMVGLDICVLMLRRGHWYGHADFNVAHFRWLDAVQPLPTQTSYNCVLLLTGLLALVGVFCSANRVMLLMVVTLYTYSWSMSLHDAFQHHYFISLVLLCLTLLPTIRADDFPSAVDPGRPQPMIVAWSFRLLGATVAIVYMYAAISKLDSAWLSGHTLRQFVGSQNLQPILQAFALSGLSEESAWKCLAVGSILIELSLAVGYLFATDRTTRRSNRFIHLGLWTLAVVFHSGVEMAGLQNIGWFSFYMILLATVFFLPSEWLLLPAALLSRTATWSNLALAWFGRRAPGSSILFIVFGLSVAMGLLAVGRYVDLPGAALAFGISAVSMIGFAATSLLRSQPQLACQYVLAWGAAGSVLLTTLFWTTTRFDYYLELGHDHHHLGQWSMATSAYEKAAKFAGVDVSNSAMAQLHIGRSLWSEGQPERAIDHFERAIRLRPAFHEAHFNLGMVLLKTGNPRNAIEHFQLALKYRPNWIPALNQTAMILATIPDAQLKNPDRAIDLARRAARLSDERDVNVLVTLAIAYKSAGRRKLALAAGKKAANLARRDGNVELAREIYQRLGVNVP